MDLNIDNYKAVIFDMDGTLFDTMGMWSELDRKFFEERKMPYPENLQKAVSGLSMDETADYFLSHFTLKESKKELKSIWNHMAYDFYHDEARLKPGALDLLKYLRNKNIKSALATSNSRELVNACFEGNDMFDYFDVIVTSNEVSHGKPAPDIYLLASQMLSVYPSDCLVFEDVINGIDAGLGAGMTVCGIDDINSIDTAPLKREKANFYIKDFRGLVKND